MRESSAKLLETPPTDTEAAEIIEDILADERKALAPGKNKKETLAKRKIREVILALSLGITAAFGGGDQNSAFAQENQRPAPEAAAAGDAESVDEEIRRLEEDLRTARQKKSEQQRAEREQHEQERCNELARWAQSVNGLIGEITASQNTHEESQRWLNFRVEKVKGIRGSTSEWLQIYDGREMLGVIKAGADDEDPEAINDTDRTFSKIEFLYTLQKMLKQSPVASDKATQKRFDFFDAHRADIFRRLLQQEFLGEGGASILRAHGVKFESGITALAIMDRYGYHVTEIDGELVLRPTKGKNGRKRNGPSFNNLTEEITVLPYGTQGLEVSIRDRGKTSAEDLVVINRGRVIDIYSGMQHFPSRDQYSEAPIQDRQ